jgi:hypothetical protein
MLMGISCRALTAVPLPGRVFAAVFDHDGGDFQGSAAVCEEIITKYIPAHAGRASTAETQRCEAR